MLTDIGTVLDGLGCAVSAAALSDNLLARAMLGREDGLGGVGIVPAQGVDEPLPVMFVSRAHGSNQS